MKKDPEAFTIKIHGKVFDYRIAGNLDLDHVKAFFGEKYIVKELWSGGRHVFGILIKDNQELFLKL